MSVDTQIDTQTTNRVDTQREKPEEQEKRRWSIGGLLKRAVGWREGRNVPVYNELTDDSEDLRVSLDEKDVMWLRKLAEPGTKPSPEELASHLDQYAYEIAADPSDEVVSGVGALLEITGERGVPARIDVPADPAVEDKIKRTINNLLGRKDIADVGFRGKGKDQKRYIEVDRVANAERAYKILHERLKPVVERTRELFYDRIAQAGEQGENPTKQVNEIAQSIVTRLQEEVRLYEGGDPLGSEDVAFLSAVFEQLYLLEVTSQVPIPEKADSKYKGLKNVDKEGGETKETAFSRDKRAYDFVHDIIYPTIAQANGLPGVIEDGKYLRIEFPQGARERFLPIEQLAGVHLASKQIEAMISEREEELRQKQTQEQGEAEERQDLLRAENAKRKMEEGESDEKNPRVALSKLPGQVQDIFHHEVVESLVEQLSGSGDVYVSLEPVLAFIRQMDPGERKQAEEAWVSFARTVRGGLQAVRYIDQRQEKQIRYRIHDDTWEFAQQPEGGRKRIKAFLQALFLPEKKPTSEVTKKPKFWQRWFQKRNVV